MKALKSIVGEREIKKALNHFKKNGYEKWDAIDAVTDQFEERGVTYQMVTGIANTIRWE